MNNNQTLCIVDMQDYFETSKHCLKGVLDEVHHAIATETPIIIVEYWTGWRTPGKKLSKTNKPIRDLVKNYEHKTYVKKCSDGGGEQVFKAAKRKKFPVDNVRMVGVNRSFCVYETAVQLLYIQEQKKIKGEVSVVKGASWCSYPTHSLSKLRNGGVKVVNKVRKYNS